MALRFRRRFKLAPGLYMNVSRGGLSWSGGAAGASMTFGQRGVSSNVGLPGTGLSFRETHGGTAKPAGAAASPPTGTKTATVSVDDEGNVAFHDSATNEPLDAARIALAKKQAGDSIKRLISDKVDEINAATEALGLLHKFVPPPVAPRYRKVEFDLPEPKRPEQKAVGLLGRVFASKREAVDRENEQAQAAWQCELAKWQRLKQSHDAREERKRKRAEEGVYADVEAMEAQLEDNLADIAGPRETNVCFEVRAGGALCVVDVDLPEIGHMPRFEAAVAGRGF